MEELTPNTRYEKFLAAAAGNEQRPDPVTRDEKFLAALSGDYNAPEPVTRDEKMLAYAAGNHDAITPNTRHEKFVAALSGDVEAPDPITREEKFWNEIAKNAEKTLTGDVVSFVGKSSTEILSLTAAITPLQDLHGYDSPWAGGAGKNLANFVNGYNIASDGSISANAKRCATLDPVHIESDVSYIYTCETGLACIYAVFNDGVLVRRQASVPSGSTLNTSGGTDLYVCTYGATDYTATVETDKPMVRKSTEPAGYAPYSNECPITGYTGANIYVSPTQNQADATTYTFDWTSAAGTVCGGTLDAVTGKLKARPQYASYSGQTLVGPWLSSMDAYAAGATPTTGAQVVDLGGTETEYTLTPQTVAALVGQNYIWADTGDVTVTVKGAKTSA